MAMLERNAIGKQVRKYFIKVEEKSKESPFTIPQTYSGALRLAADLSEQNEQLQLCVAQKDQTISVLEPKAAYVDWILKSKSTMNINAIAKDYGMSGRKMNKILHGFGVQYCQDKQWLLYAKYQNKGYTHSKTIDFEHTDGSPDTQLHTQWTQKSRLFLYELLKKNGIVPVIERDTKTA